MVYRRRKFFRIIRMFLVLIPVFFIAVFISLSQINMETLRSDLISILRSSTGLPIEIKGDVSWKFSLRPKVELNKVSVQNADWAKNKDGFSAEKIELTLDLISLLQDKPTIKNVKIHSAKLNLEKNDKGIYSIQPEAKKIEQEPKTPEKIDTRYPFNLDLGLGAIEVNGINVNLGKSNYKMNGFKIEYNNVDNAKEYTGWIRSGLKVYPFIGTFYELDPIRKVYPIRFAISSGGDALVASIALEKTSKLPIDFKVSGTVPDIDKFGEVFGMSLPHITEIKVNIAGGMDYKKLTIRKSSLKTKESDLSFWGDYNWEKTKPIANIFIESEVLNFEEIFPDTNSNKDTKYVRPNRPLNVFKDTPLFGYLLNEYDLNLSAKLDNMTVYRDLNIEKISTDVKLKNSNMDVVVDTSIGGGVVKSVVNVIADNTGKIYAKAAGDGDNISFGNVLEEVHQYGYLSDLPINFDFYFQADGSDLTELMSTITGPFKAYSAAPGYIHSKMVSYMYGADFLTTLRHQVEDMFSTEKDYQQMTANCVAVNFKLRNGVVETENGIAIETNAVNMKLKGKVDLGGETMDVQLVTFPVRGIKLSLSGNIVNMTEIVGSMAEPSINISGSAVASKVVSATGLGLLLAPFTGGIGLVAGAGVGFFAGDFLENWLADDHPCETAMTEGAPSQPDDPLWLNAPIDELVGVMI